MKYDIQGDHITVSMPLEKFRIMVWAMTNYATNEAKLANYAGDYHAAYEANQLRAEMDMLQADLTNKAKMGSKQCN